MPYFSIYTGLRGMYMPDGAYIIKADTRRELKSTLQWEADSIRDAGGIGLSKKTIAKLAAIAWRERKFCREYVAPYRYPYHGKRNYCMGLGVFTGMTRKEYIEQKESW
jgi:hypothetical protein